MQDVRSFSLGFFVRAGSGDEPPARQGISHFLEHVLFKRTRRRSTVEIARAIDRLGRRRGRLHDQGVHGLLRPHSRLALLRGPGPARRRGPLPAFESVDIEVERGVILEELGEANDNPEDLVHEMFVRSFWRSHPLGAPILGTRRDGRAIGLADLYRYYRSRYRPDNLIVSVAGHVRAARMLDAIERLFRRRLPVSRPGAGRRIRRARRGHQDLLLKSAPGPRAGARLPRRRGARSRASERRYAANLLDIVLGGGMSSRLFQEVREKRGLASSIASSLNSYRLGRLRDDLAACAPKNLGRLLEVTLAGAQEVEARGVRPRELAWAKENLKGNMVLALESTVSRMSMQARQRVLLRPGRLLGGAIARVEAVTSDDVGEEAERLFDGRFSPSPSSATWKAPHLRAPDLAGALGRRGRLVAPRRSCATSA